MMRIARTYSELCRGRQGLAELGLVPTMGALHGGHLRLLAAARERGLRVAASIFVNPLQFGPTEDLDRYPRDEAGDLAKLEAAGCDLVWLPGLAEMYPPDAATTLRVAGPAERWEGAARPGHFAGVATVVAKLFGQVRPMAAFFGEKDWQQLQVIRRMTRDLLLPVEIIGVPTLREADGLAMSSRNRFLTPAERRAAPALYAALCGSAREIAQGCPVARALAAGEQALETAGLRTDYLALVDAHSLLPQATFSPPARLIAAARLGSVRLLDNVPV